MSTPGDKPSTEPDMVSIDRFRQDNGELSRTKIYEEIKSGRLRAVKVGARTMITREDGKKWRNALTAIAN